MPLGPESLRVAIAGATSLRGKDLKEWMEESGFPAGEIRLLDEELAAGTLTEVGGEPAVVQPIDDASFDGIRFAFFAGSAPFTAEHAPAALRAGATVIDLSGSLDGFAGARLWVPALDSLLPQAAQSVRPSGRIDVCVSPSVPAIIAIAISAALAGSGLTRLTILFMQPVSERGRAGVAELEGQTAKLLSMQAMPQEVFDAQVAFNLLDRWGSGSVEKLADWRDRAARETSRYLLGRAPVPALTIIQVPVFFGYGFSAYAEFSELPTDETMLNSLRAADFKVISEDDPVPSNLSVASETQAHIRLAHRDGNSDQGCWFWGAADNMRLGSVNAVRIAERLLAS